MSQIFPSRITLALIPESGVTVCVQDIGMSDLTDVECLGSDSSFLYTRPECVMSQCLVLLLLFWHNWSHLNVNCFNYLKKSHKSKFINECDWNRMWYLNIYEKWSLLREKLQYFPCSAFKITCFTFICRNKIGFLSGLFILKFTGPNVHCGP